MYKKLVSLILVLLLLTTNVLGSNDYQIINENLYATVTKVFDAEAMEIKLLSTGEVALVKLIGINSQGYDGGYEYINNRLLGKQVLITYDTTVYTPNKNWNLVYMRESGDLINTKLIELGYAQAELSTSTHSIYTNYERLANKAKSNNVGMWEDKGLVSNEATSQYYYDTNTININTATEHQIRTNLEDISSTLASNIVNYRKNNPFNSTEEIKFVSGMTKEIYDKNIRLMHVVTNINKAKHTELSTLKNITSNEADSIIEYRDKKGTIYLKNLVNDNVLSNSDYQANIDFLSENDETNVYITAPDRVVNINTATSSELSKAGLSNSNATKIIKLREEGYTFKNIGELELIDTLSISHDDFQKIQDNLTVKTNINTATNYELSSLFSGTYSGMTSDINTIINNRDFKNIIEIKEIIGATRYDTIKQFIYVDKYANDYININTATVKELTDLGISSSYANSIVNYSKNINDFSQIPVNITKYDDQITLYTNINNASINELLSLDGSMTISIANDIIDYYKDQPFGNHSEFKEYMADSNFSSVYDKIKDFIVFR